MIGADTSGSTHGATGVSRAAARSKAAGRPRTRQGGVAGPAGEGHGEGAVVPGEDGEAEVAEVGRDRALLGRGRGAGKQAVEARPVDDPRLLGLLLHRAEAGGGEPARHVGAGPGGEHHGVAAHLRPVGQAHARDPPVVGDEPSPDDPVTQGHRGLSRRRPSQHPLEGRAAAGEEGEVAVVGVGRRVHAVGPQVGHLEQGGPRGQETGQHVGVAVPEQVAQAGQEGVGVVDLGGAPAVGRERLVRGGGQGQGVAFEHGDGVALPAEREGGGEAPDPTPDHDDARHAVDPRGSAPRRRFAPDPVAKWWRGWHD